MTLPRNFNNLTSFRFELEAAVSDVIYVAHCFLFHSLRLEPEK